MFLFLMIFLFLNSAVAEARRGSEERLQDFLKPSASFGVPFIINGWPADVGEWPCQTSIQVTSSGRWRHICGGVLVSKNFVITAAHCGQYSASLYRVVLGAHNISDPSDGYYRYVQQIYIHPFYNSSTLMNDISLFKLDRPAVLNARVKICPLPCGNASFEEATCYITGWGSTSGVNPTYPSVLQEARIPVINNTYCRYLMRNVGNAHIGDCHICVYNAVSSSCQGDSGGPLFCRRCQEEEWMVVGVTSWGVGNIFNRCMTNYPSVYTRTSCYVEWLCSTVGDDLRLLDTNGVCPANDTNTPC